MRRDDQAGVSRRHLLTVAASLSTPVWAQTGSAEPTSAPAHPRDVGRKFNADGSPMPFVGNSFVGHLDQQGPQFETFDALLDIHRDMPRQPFAGKLTLVPPSSWHVTLIGGINDVDRRTAAWPDDLARDTPIDDVHRLLLARLEQRRAPVVAPCTFIFDAEHRPRARVEGSLGLPLRPADTATAGRLRAARDELADMMRLRRPDHDRYGFHVTLAYIFRFLDAKESAALQSAAVAWTSRLAALGPLTIPAFHFCVLRDMFAFRVLRPV